MFNATLGRALTIVGLCVGPIVNLPAQDAPSPRPQITAPPETYFQAVRERDRAAARAFYRKHLDIGGVHCTAGGDVADEALLRTHELVTRMLAGRPDILQTMAEHGTRLIIIGKDQVYTDMPEYRNHRNPTFQNERVRGTGGLDVTSFGEENLLNLALDRYDDESIAVHEFCHTIDAALARLDSTWIARRNAAYQNAVSAKLYKYAYAGGNPAEYWAESCQAYFDCNRVNNWNHAAVGTREQLQEYDPVGFELVRTTFRLTRQNDWRFRPLRTQPSVMPPPERLHYPDFYKKFTWARELPVLSSGQVSDEALLSANQIVRRMFAYRHDLLKALINDGGRIVILSKAESLTDLPEFQHDKTSDLDGLGRIRAYTVDRKLIVIPEDNLLPVSADRWQGKCHLVELLAKAVYTVAAHRDVDERFAHVRSDSQQYEQRLLWNQPPEIIARMDERYDVRVRELFARAVERGLWQGTPAARDPLEYWSSGVSAYFDAVGRGYPPVGSDWPITTREHLRDYDPDLFQLVHETMLYAGHQDWRWNR